MREVNARVEEDEQESGDEDEGAVEDEEAGLVLHDFVAPAAGHFSDTVIRCALVICSRVCMMKRMRTENHTGRCIGSR